MHILFQNDLKKKKDQLNVIQNVQQQFHKSHFSTEISRNTTTLTLQNHLNKQEKRSVIYSYILHRKREVIINCSNMLPISPEKIGLRNFLFCKKKAKRNLKNIGKK